MAKKLIEAEIMKESHGGSSVSVAAQSMAAAMKINNGIMKISVIWRNGSEMAQLASKRESKMAAGESVKIIMASMKMKINGIKSRKWRKRK
jgi:hypothetical protein